ncbi:unnamed protein product [Caenorhabditis brenneri]
MPVDVVGLIIDRSEYKQQLKLRKTSKSLRALVDKHKPACKSVEVYCCMKSVDITFNNQWVMYRSLDSECEPYTRIIVKRDDFMKVAFDDLASTLKNPKLQLEEFFLSKLQNFEYCRIEQCCRNNINDVQRMTGIPVPPNMSHYLIPDSDYCLEFSIAANDITIVKKMCHLH